MAERSFREWLAGVIRGKEGEQTGPQRPAGVGGAGASGGSVGGKDTITDPLPRNFATWREMRNQPTIAMARAIPATTLTAAPFALEATDEAPPDAKDFIENLLEPLWPDLLGQAVYALDYGYQPWEIVYRLDAKGRLDIDHLKPLRQEMTSALLDKTTGAFAGAKNGGGGLFGDTGKGIVLPPEKLLWYVIDREGQNYYGNGMLERAREAYNDWRETRARMARYLTGAAGAVPMLEYPRGGESVDETGATRDNYQIAVALVSSLAKSRGICVPGLSTDALGELAAGGADPAKFRAWKFDFLESKTLHGAEYLDGLRYDEVQMLRAFLVPERAATEGQYGTKAEAATHGEVALANAQRFVGELVRVTNRYLIIRLLVYNWGDAAEDTVKLATPDPQPELQALLSQLVAGLFGAPVNADLAAERIDLDAVLDRLGVPKSSGSDATIPFPAQAVTGRDAAAPIAAEGIGEINAAGGVTAVVPDLVLNGAQVKAAQDIVSAVAAGQLPRDSGMNMLMIFFGISRENADAILGAIGQGFTPPPPASPPSP